ncbi:MAG: RecQ family ATP-dependent DNA helicase [Bacteroidia bacterium]|nr:RecQ family ATP-dependent DNA helicase [Bacteroidia bacterium]
MKEKIYNILKKYWNYDSFRPLQEDIILSVMNGQDTIALLPTGGGKSMCFQIPGLCFDNGITLVISPLIALMHDQVNNLKKKGISAASITSSMPHKEIEKTIQNVLDGEYRFLYVSPERLETKQFQSILPELKINLLAIDEAHCVSQWGYDFRPSYLKISEIKNHLYNPNIPTIALTATATQKVLNDIIEKLHLKNPTIFRQSFARNNLRYIVLYEQNKLERMIKIIQNVGGAGIVYVRSRNKTKEISDYLNTKGVKAEYFHAGLRSEEKYLKQKQFIENVYQVMVATNAFGMGIDKPDVRYVIHYELSDSIEGYFQEAGRGGRDLKTSYAVLLYQETDKEKLWKMFDESFPSLEQIKNVYNTLCNYYELAIDEGAGNAFDFDITTISKLYKLPLSLVYNSVKFLQLFDLLDIEDEVYQPSRCCIHYSKLDLYDFYLRHPEFEDLIKVLLRSYGGILGNYVYIDENEIAYRIKREKKYIIQQLNFLDKEGILSYLPLTGFPKITFLKDRIPLSKLKLDEEKYHFLKERRKFFTEKMIEYAEQKYVCRQQFLLNYFDEKTNQPCGYCDVCLEHKRLKNIDLVKQKITEHLKQTNNKYSVEELCKVFYHFRHDIIIQSIREMIDDNLLMQDEKGLIQLKSK